MRKRVASQPKISAQKTFARLKDLSPVKFSSRPSIGVVSFLGSGKVKNNITQNFSSPRLNPFFPHEAKIPRPSIIELLIAKHRSSNSKLSTPSCLNKTVSTRPATVTSPNLFTDPGVRSPDGFEAIAEKLSRDTPAITVNVKKYQTELLEGYTILKEIGRGAYAVVKSARCTKDNKIVAIKIYDKLKTLTPSRKKNVDREIKILERLEHPSIVKLFHTIETKKSLNLIMEHISGCSLIAYLKKRPKKRLDESEARRIFIQILSALEYCHSLNITHRDIKLENILIDTSHTVKIIDFGFSTCFSNEKKISLFCGTPSYMSPEIVGKYEAFGPPSDIWAAGVVLYVLLTGVFPFKAPHTRELYSKIQKGAFLIPAFLTPEASSLITAMICIDPYKRPSAKLALEYSWFKEKPLGKTQSIIERPNDVPNIRVSLNNTFDKGKTNCL